MDSSRYAEDAQPSREGVMRVRPGRMMVTPADNISFRDMDTIPMDAVMIELGSMTEQYAMLAERVEKQLSTVMREPGGDLAGPAPSRRGGTPLANQLVEIAETLRRSHARMVDLLDRVDL